MSIEENKAVMRRWFELADFKGIPKSEIESTMKKVGVEIFSPDFILRLATGDMTLESYLQYMIARLNAFPDMNCTIETLVAEGDIVVACMTVRGTHQGEFFGVPATGKNIEQRLAAIGRLTDGKFVEGWGYYWGGANIMEQLGASPPQ